MLKNFGGKGLRVLSECQVWKIFFEDWEIGIMLPRFQKGDTGNVLSIEVRHCLA